MGTRFRLRHAGSLYFVAVVGLVIAATGALPGSNALAHLNGAFDHRFGEHGSVLAGSSISTIRSDRRGRIYLGGGYASEVENCQPAGDCTGSNIYKAGLVRLRANGERVQSFGIDGFLHVPQRPIVDFERESDGSVAALFSAGGVARIKTVGVQQGLVTSIVDKFVRPFGATGVASRPFRELEAGADGTFVIAGGRLVTRLRGDGTIDPAFGARGATVLPPGSINDMVTDQQGRLVVAGRFRRSGRFFGLVRLLPDGSVDRKFGDGGYLPLRGPMRKVAAVAVARDGKILFGGRARWFKQSCVSVIRRVWTGGRLDRQFGRSGEIRWNLRASNPEFECGLESLAIGPRGDIAAGNAASVLLILKSGKRNRSMAPKGFLRVPSPYEYGWVGSVKALEFTGSGALLVGADGGDSELYSGQSMQVMRLRLK